MGRPKQTNHKHDICPLCNLSMHKGHLRYHLIRKHHEMQALYRELFKTDMPNLMVCRFEGCTYAKADRATTLETHHITAHAAERTEKHARSFKLVIRKNIPVLKEEYLRDARYYNEIILRVHNAVHELIHRRVVFNGVHNVGFPGTVNHFFPDTEADFNRLYAEKKKEGLAKALVAMRDLASIDGGALTQDRQPATWEQVAEEFERMLEKRQEEDPFGDYIDDFVMPHY